MEPQEVIVSARRAAGMTQAELADAVGTTQPAIARLEARGSNPRIHTVERILDATGHDLELSLAPHGSRVDESQIRELLRLTPSERLAAFTVSYRKMRDLLERVRRPTQ